MTKKSVYDVTGGYSCEYPAASDFYQWLKIARIFDIGFVKDATVFYFEGTHSETYRFIVSSPIGYLDRLKIILQTILDVKEEYKTFLPEINQHLYVLVFKYLIASFLWIDSDKVFHSSFFIGLAHFSMSLIKPRSFFEYLKKCGIYFIILIVHVLIIIPPVKNFFKRIIQPIARKSVYMGGQW
jgi:hypothetical protein